MASRSDLAAKEVLTVVDSAQAGVSEAVVTAPGAEKGLTIYVTGFWISGSAAAASPVSATLEDGSTVVVQLEIPGSTAFAPIRASYNTHPIRITPGQDATLTLPSLGGTAIGTVVLEYYIGTI